jgi:predicted nuclease of predicted toxin-antitoxin system
LRFLLDENLSPELVNPLVDAGHDVVHVRSIGLLRAPDRTVLERARIEHRIIVSADTDFGQLLAHSQDPLPSVILLRTGRHRRALGQATLILANLPQVQSDLDAGAIVVIEANRVRVRRLPLTSEPS